MREFIEYVCILLHVGTDLEGLEKHLYMNGYDFGIDKTEIFSLCLLTKLIM